MECKKGTDVGKTVQSQRWRIQRIMPHYTKPLKKVIGKLKKASKAHASQAKTLTRIMKDQKKGYKKVVKKKKA